jgi:aldehyde:ferredoxin oxidoreductase
VSDVQAYGRRRLNMMRALNAREGIASDRDTLPRKLFEKALKGGRSDGIVLDDSEFKAGLAMYYLQAGWDTTTGIPTRDTLQECGLSWVADDLDL